MAATSRNDPPTYEKMNGQAEKEPAMDEKTNGPVNGHMDNLSLATTALPEPSTDTSGSSSNACSIDTGTEFQGDVNTNNEIPTQEVLRQVEDMTVLDRDGKIIPFKHLYSGPNVTRRVLVIFIRHFFCGVRPLPATSSPRDPVVLLCIQ